MAVTCSDTKAAVVVRDDLATWQQLNVTAFRMRGSPPTRGAVAIGDADRDADGRAYSLLLVQPACLLRPTLHAANRPRARRAPKRRAGRFADRRGGTRREHYAAMRRDMEATVGLVPESFGSRASGCARPCRRCGRLRGRPWAGRVLPQR